MLQIHNVDNGKSEWNINETHIIIPVIDPDNKESDKILTSTLALNSLEGVDQAILTNGLEHSLVIGLDKTLFETSNYKSDLVIIQNSDMKNPVAYALSYVDQDKGEILWQSPSPKDKTGNKAMLEVRDILSYDVNELEKTEQIMGGLDSEIASQVTKDGEILTSVMVEGKKESHCDSYYSSLQNSETVSVSAEFDMTKFMEGEETVENKKLLENKCEQNIKSSGFGLGENTQGIPLNITKEGIEINNLLPLKLVENVETEKKDKFLKNMKAKGENIERKDEGLLYEESLPLKKKAKMKRTLLLNLETQKSLLKQDMMAADQLNSKFAIGRKARQPLTNLQEEEDRWSSDSDEPLINKVTTRKKGKVKINSKKCKKSITNSLAADEHESNKSTNSSLEDVPRKTDNCEFDIQKFNNIFDLIECLRKCRMINGTVWQTLQLGLKEMKVDILKEMNAKRSDENLPEVGNYSPQLKAFALVLYFKQPAAFNHLAHVYKGGWPSLNVIKEWKRRLNNRPRPNFVRVRQREESKP